MAPKVQTPVEGFTGKVAGVSFADGVGETENRAALSYFARHGYAVGGGDAGKELTPKQKLQVEAKSLGLSEEGTKDDLEARIAEHKKAAEKQPGDGEQNPPAGDEGKDQG